MRKEVLKGRLIPKVAGLCYRCLVPMGCWCEVECKEDGHADFVVWAMLMSVWRNEDCWKDFADAFPVAFVGAEVERKKGFKCFLTWAFSRAHGGPVNVVRLMGWWKSWLRARRKAASVHFSV